MTHVKPGKPLAALALILVAYSPALLAQAVQQLYSPIILVRDMVSTKSDPDARPIQMREDGSGFARINSVGVDLSYVGGAGGRYFLGMRANAAVSFPDGAAYQDFVTWHENGDQSTLRVLTTYDPTLSRGGVRWSADGNRVIYDGRRYDTAGNVVESGVYVGDVEWSGGVPSRVFNERLVAADIPVDRVTASGGLLDASAQRVVFSMTRDVVDNDGNHLRYESGMFVAAVRTATESEPRPQPATPIRILLSRPDLERSFFAFSPVPGDERLLYSERETPTNPYVRYLWTVDVPQDYDGSYPLTPTAITTKSNSSANYLFSVAGWSPTGTLIVFTSARSTMWTENQVYKIASNGRGKAIRLTSRADAYTGVMWRP